MVLLGHLPIWPLNPYAESREVVGTVSWRAAHPYRERLRALHGKHDLPFDEQTTGELVINVGERIAIDPDADFALWAAYHLVSLPVAVTVTVH